VAEFEKGADLDEIAKAIVGTTVVPGGRRRAPTVEGEVVLAVKGLHAGARLHGVDLEVRAGEIVGIAGVVGNGQSELVLAVAGLLRPMAGTISLAGADVTRASARDRLALGLGHIAEDRHLRGAILDFDLAENVILGRLGEVTSRAGFLRRDKIDALARERLSTLDVRPGDPGARFGSLSGGNQQKVVVGRELGRPGLRLLLAAEPTRGVDIGATAAIHGHIRTAAKSAAVLLVSSELSELRALADRIIVMYRGQIAGTVAPDASDETLGALMTGVAA
jgi:simple sugar transport system ATP-binding protein